MGRTKGVFALRADQPSARRVYRHVHNASAVTQVVLTALIPTQRCRRPSGCGVESRSEDLLATAVPSLRRSASHGRPDCSTNHTPSGNAVLLL